MSSLTSFRERLRQYADQTALIDGDQVFTYQQLEEEIERAGEVLRKYPDPVLLIGHDYSLATIALLFSAANENRMVAPLTTRREEEIERCARACGATRLLIDKQGQWEARPLPDVPLPALAQEHQQAGKSGLILFSSGTTGEPKAMLHDMGKLIASYLDRKPRSLNILLFLLFDHIGGLNTLFGSLAAGMTLVITRQRDPETVGKLIAHHRVRILPTTPTFLNLLLLSDASREADLSSLRVITYGAEPMSESLLERVKTAFPRARLVQTFGTSETGIVKTQPQLDTSLRIDDPRLEKKIVAGELWLRGETRIIGYLNVPNDRFTEDGWFRTGDLVEETTQGAIHFLGRSVEIINVGGEKVFPAEVETVLLEIPEVGACRVYGQSHPITGQIVAVDIVPTRNTDPVALRSKIRTYTGKKLARHKIPVKMNFVNQIGMGDRLKRQKADT